jgi:phosphatidate cytidylyltransferase
MNGLSRFTFLSSRDFLLRVASSVVLVGMVVWITWAGGWINSALWIGAAALVLWEWIKIVQNGHWLWRVAGVIYAAATAFGPLVLRHQDLLGFQVVVWLFTVVWITDILAFLIGRSMGGPKLWRRVSPNKTWSGFCGGVICGTFAGCCVAYAVAVPHLEPVAVLSVLAALATQGGDLLESGLKRAFHVKDSGALIPGHGGVMDRLDGCIVAGALMATIGICRGGLDAAAAGVLIW